MFAVLIAAASTISATVPASPATAPAAPSVQCRVTVEIAGPRYHVRCPAMPISPTDGRARTERAPDARSVSSRGR